jgi:hypothetical protein
LHFPPLCRLRGYVTVPQTFCLEAHLLLRGRGGWPIPDSVSQILKKWHQTDFVGSEVMFTPTVVGLPSIILIICLTSCFCNHYPRWSSIIPFTVDIARSVYRTLKAASYISWHSELMPPALKYCLPVMKVRL